MPNLSFRIDSVRAERYSFELVHQLNINMNIMFGKPESKDNSFLIGFVVKIDCTPPMASIDIKGLVIVTPMNQDEYIKLGEEFKKGTMPYPLVIAVYSYTLPIISLLSRELGIPPPIQFPIQPSHREKGADYHL
ncbi:MAG: hypothetical protein QXJ56_00130 [Ignisphaera sp.]